MEERIERVRAEHGDKPSKYHTMRVRDGLDEDVEKFLETDQAKRRGFLYKADVYTTALRNLLEEYDHGRLWAVSRPLKGNDVTRLEGSPAVEQHSRKRARKKRGTERVPFKRTCEYEYCKQEFITSHSHQKYCDETCRRFDTLKKAKEKRRLSMIKPDDKSDLWDLGLRLSKDHYSGSTLGTSQVTTNLKVIDTPQGPRIKGARALERFSFLSAYPRRT